VTRASPPSWTSSLLSFVELLIIIIIAPADVFFHCKQLFNICFKKASLAKLLQRLLLFR